MNPIVTKIGCVVRFWSGTKIDFLLTIKRVSLINFDYAIFVMDKSLKKTEEYSYNEKLYEIYIHNYLTSEECLCKNYIIIHSGGHYNGTGSFNIAFEYIRKNEIFNDYLFAYFDDDDYVQVKEFNNLISLIKSNDITSLGFQFNTKDLKNNQKIEIEKVQYNLTSSEKELLNNPREFKFRTNHIINYSNIAKTHLYEYMHKTNCNMWSYLWSPVYYKDVTCRLLPFGREDLDMINALMSYGPQEISYRGKSELDTFMVSGDLIRINGLFKGNVFNGYDHVKGNGQGDYMDLKELNKKDISITNYINNHQNNINHLNKFPIRIKNSESTKYIFNKGDKYTNTDSEFGIKSFGGILDNENVLGELHIASYKVIEKITDENILMNIKSINKDSPKDLVSTAYESFLLEIHNKAKVNYMFMNGKSLEMVRENKDFYENVRKINPEDANSTDEAIYNKFKNIFNSHEEITKWNAYYESLRKPDTVHEQSFGGGKLTWREILLICLLIPFAIFIIIVAIVYTINSIYKNNSIDDDLQE